MLDNSPEILQKLTPLVDKENLVALPLEFNLALLATLVLGLLLLYLTFSRMKQRRFLSSSIFAVMSCLIIAVSIALLAVGINLQSYARISHEQKVATITFKKLSTQQFIATLTFADNVSSEYLLSGDEWQIDARIIKWNLPATLAGLNSLYRLDRLAGRYQNIEEEKSAQRSVYSLTKNEGFDFWSFNKKHAALIPWVYAYYGTATYLPMEHQAEFEITLSQTGLIARPTNIQGQESVKFWD